MKVGNAEAAFDGADTAASTGSLLDVCEIRLHTDTPLARETFMRLAARDHKALNLSSS